MYFIKMMSFHSSIIVKECLKHMKMAIACIVLFGVVPPYCWLKFAMLMTSCLLPHWISQAADDVYYSVYQKMVLFFFENVAGIQLLLYGDVEEVTTKKEKIIYISNHQCTADWVLVNMLADRQGSVGHIRYVIKDSLKMVPLFGSYLFTHGCVFVKRHYFNFKKMISSLKYLQNPKINTWLVIFPEGTRYNPEKSDLIERSQSFAKSRGLMPLKHVLTPKYKGFHIALEHMKSNLDAVYDATVIYSCTKGNTKTLRTKAPSMFEFVTGCCDVVYVHIKRIDVSIIPASESEFKLWLHNLFLIKDKLLEDYYDGKPSKNFSSSKGYKLRAKPLQNLGSFLFFVTLNVLFLSTPCGWSLYWRTAVFAAVLGYLLLGIWAVIGVGEGIPVIDGSVSRKAK